MVPHEPVTGTSRPVTEWPSAWSRARKAGGSAAAALKMRRNREKKRAARSRSFFQGGHQLGEAGRDVEGEGGRDVAHIARVRGTSPAQGGRRPHTGFRRGKNETDVVVAAEGVAPRQPVDQHRALLEQERRPGGSCC